MAINHLVLPSSSMVSSKFPPLCPESKKKLDLILAQIQSQTSNADASRLWCGDMSRLYVRHGFSCGMWSIRKIGCIFQNLVWR